MHLIRLRQRFARYGSRLRVPGIKRGLSHPGVYDQHETSSPISASPHRVGPQSLPNLRRLRQRLRSRVAGKASNSYDGRNAAANAVDYLKFYSRSPDAVIRVQPYEGETIPVNNHDADVQIIWQLATEAQSLVPPPSYAL